MRVLRYKFKKVRMKSNLKQFFCLMFFLFISFSFPSCSKDNNVKKDKKKVNDIVLPITFKDIEPYVSLHGDTNSDSVIINIQGGPILSLDDKGLDSYIKSSDTEDVLYVNVHQAQTLEPDLFSSKITREDAIRYNQKSVKILKKVMDYYLYETNKFVYFLGISYGGFLLQDLIKQYGTPYVSGCLVVGARICLDKEASDILSCGNLPKYTFDCRGKAKIKALKVEDDIASYNMSILFSALACKDYTEDLHFIKLLSRTIFIYGERDDFLGPISEKEMDFLKKRKVNIICTNMANHRFTIHKSLSNIKEIFKLK